MVPILAMILSLVNIIRRVELSLSPGHPTLLLYCAGLGAALTHCVLLAAASKETVAAFLFVASTAMQASPYPSTSPSPSPNPNPNPNPNPMQAVQVCMYCTLSAADLAVTLETHLLRISLSESSALLGAQRLAPLPLEASTAGFG